MARESSSSWTKQTGEKLVKKPLEVNDTKDSRKSAGSYVNEKSEDVERPLKKSEETE